MANRPSFSEEPEGLETRPPVVPLPTSGKRPDWLVGAESVLEGDLQESRPEIPPQRPPGNLAGGADAGKPEKTKAWTGAASSIPKLTVVPKVGRPAAASDSEDQPLDIPGDQVDPSGDHGARSKPSHPTGPTFRPLDEPWYLVWGEALATNRKVQLLALAAIALIGVLVMRPRIGQSGASLGGILRHPDRYEGRSVMVRGEVLESFDIGQGHVFHLRQGRDTVVVFSPSRRPRLHERVEVVGTVSTGYLDGEPRVAIFEAAK
jgi:hypothetical protein